MNEQTSASAIVRFGMSQPTSCHSGAATDVTNQYDFGKLHTVIA